MMYVVILIKEFDNYDLPIIDGSKLNGFLAGVLKSKKIRLHKKNENAKCFSQSIQAEEGLHPGGRESKVFSSWKNGSIVLFKDHWKEQKQKFCMQEEWRELFYNFCVTVGNHLDADIWLSIVEEIYQRMSVEKDAA